MCSKYADHFWLNSQYEGGAPIWLLNEHENLHFHNEQDIHRAPKIMKMAMGTIWFC
jgi:hypothetical protein